MTTENDTVQDRIAYQGKSQVVNEGVPSDGFADPEGKYPKKEYAGEPSVNKAARGKKVFKLKDNPRNHPKAIYPLNQVSESTSGHVIEVNDTPGGERILIKHKDGHGIEISPDGSIFISNTGKKAEFCRQERILKVGGNGEIVYYGNLNLTVHGDYNLDVKGDYNVKVGGNHILNVVRNYRKHIVGAFNEVIQKTKSSTILQKVSNVCLNGFSSHTKGTYFNEVDGVAEYAHSGNTFITSETQMNMTSVDVNVAANNLSVFGDEGTIGGDNITMFAQNSYVDRTLHASEVEAKKTMKAKVFHGDLNGTAKGAVKAGTAALGASHGGSVNTTAHSIEDPVAQGKKYKPTKDILDSHCLDCDQGIRQVRIDRDSAINDGIDQTKNSDGITDKKLNTGQIRSKLKEPNNLKNEKFVESQIANGVLNPAYASLAPGSTGRIKSMSQTARSGVEEIGNRQLQAATKKFTLRESSSRGVERTIAVDQNFDPNNQRDITMQTHLAKGVPISKFVASDKDPVNFDHTKSSEERKTIARNLYPQANIINTFNQLKKFEGYDLVVAEGLYKKGPKEILSDGSPKKLAENGRSVAYEIYDSTTGNIANDKIFDFATYLKDNSDYEKISLYYDNYDPNGSLNSQIVVNMPSIPENYTAYFNRRVETVYNGTVQTTTDLVEILST